MAHTTPKTAATSRSQECSTVAAPLPPTPANASDLAAPLSTTSVLVSIPEEWKDDEFRRAYMEATVHQDIAWQIRINREQRGMSQHQLAQLVGTRQSAISRLEDAEYDGRTIPTLIKVANAFQCALRVQLVPYSQLAKDTIDTSDQALVVQTFSAELEGRLS